MVLAILVFLLPGAALARMLGFARREDVLAGAAAAVVLSVATATTAAFVSLLVGVPADELYGVLIALAVVAAPFLFLPVRQGPELEAAPGWTTLAGLATLAAVAVYAAWAGASFRFTGDAADHLGTLREILASGAYFPTDAFHPDAGLLGSDPRKGLMHPVLAALSRLSGLSPVDFWRSFPAMAALLPFLGGYGFLRFAGFSGVQALVGGWCVLLTWSGGLVGDLIGISPYPNQMGAPLFWLAAGGAVLAVAQPSPRTALFAAFTAIATVADHPMYLVFVVTVYGLLGLYTLLPQHRGAPLISLAASGAVAAIVLVPYLLFRFSQYAPANPIHTDIQGMLWLGDRLFIADPARLWGHLGWAGLLGYPAVAWTLRRDPRQSPGRYYVLATVGVMLLVLTLNPLTVPLIQKKLSYLIFRSFWLFPPGLAAGLAMTLAWGAGGRRTRALALVLSAAVVVPTLLHAPNLARTTQAREGSLDALRWRDALASFGAQLPHRSVVLSDPITSQLLPAFTPYKVVAPFDQHSSPNDSLVVTRLLTARDVLSPLVPMGEAWEMAVAAGAKVVLINEAFPGARATAYWHYDPAAAAVRREDLAHSRGFSKIWEQDGFTAFGVLGTRPRTRENRAAAVRGRERTINRAPQDPLVLADGRMAVWDLTFHPRTLHPGDTLVVDLAWAGTHYPQGPKPLTASLRMEAVEAPGRGAFADKWRRKMAERQTGMRLRARVDWIPAGGWWPPDRWPERAAVKDRVRLPLPANMAAGRYAVTLTAQPLPHMPNHHVRDYLQDRDLYSGTVVDTLVVIPN